MIEATIRRGSARAQEWTDVLGALTVPLESPIEQKAVLPGLGERSVYRVAVGRLSTEQIERLIAHLARKFHIPLEDVRRDLLRAEHGLPILAEDVIVSIPLRAFL